MDEIINQLPQKAKEKHQEHKAFFKKLKKKPPKNLDYIMQELHDEEFERTDCLQPKTFEYSSSKFFFINCK